MNLQKFTKNYFARPGLGLLSAAPEDLFTDLDSRFADARQGNEEDEERLERLEPLIDSVQEAQLTEQLPLRQEIARFRHYIDPLWAESVGFVTTVFQRAGIEHEEWPEVSAEIDVADATGWFTERAREFGDGITSLQNTAIIAALEVQKTDLESELRAALDDQKNDLNFKAEKVQEAVLHIQKQCLESEASRAQKAAIDAALAAQKKDLAELQNQLDRQTTQHKRDMAELHTQLDCEKKALEEELRTSHDELKAVLRERDDAREANKDLDARVLNLSTHNKRATAEADAANDQAIGLVSRLCSDLHITMADHNSASWAELWKDVSNDLHDQIHSAHELQCTLQTETLEAAEQFAQAVFDAQGISHRWPKLEFVDLTSIKTWFACRGYIFEQAAKRDQIARESKILEGLHHFALFSTGAANFPRTLLAGCDLSALKRWLEDRTSEVSKRLCFLEEKWNFGICLAVYSLRLQDRVSARCAEQMEHTDILQDRLRILAGRYQEETEHTGMLQDRLRVLAGRNQDLLLAQRN